MPQARSMIRRAVTLAQSSLSRLGIAGAAVLLFFAACDDPLSPGRLAGTYAMQSVGGIPIPTVLWEGEITTATVFADTIELFGNGRGRWTTVARYVQRYDGSSRDEHRKSDIIYSISDQRIVINHPCPGNADCVAPPHFLARLTGDVLIVDPVYFESYGWTYARVE